MLFGILTGFVAGAVHVVSGTDHLVAIAPAAFERPKSALRNGLAWGLGHSTGVVILSVIGVFIKDFVHIQRLSLFAEFSVGLVLLVAGVLAIRNAFGMRIHAHHHKHGKVSQHKHIHFHFLGNKKHNKHSHSVTSIGVLHGLAGGSHLLAVIPALALPPIGAFIYIFAYLLGSIFAMELVVLFMAFATFKAGRKSLPIIVGLAGCLSIATGLIWVQRSSIYMA